MSAPLPRALLGPLLAAMLIWPSLFQPILNSTYSFLRNAAFYRASTFETWWTVIVYSTLECSYTYRFAHNPQLRLANPDKRTEPPLPKMQRPKNRVREGLIYIGPLLLMDLTMIKKFAGVPLEEIALSGNHLVPDRTDGRVNSNFLTPTLHRFTISSPLQTQRALPAVAPSTRQLILQLLCSFLIYDTLFFFFHLGLHKLPYLRHLHSTHHNHAEIHPQITNKLDIVERLGLIMLANFSLNIIGSHVLTRTLFVPLFVWLLVDIHSGLDQEWGYDKLLPFSWGSGSKRHSFHHKHGTKYYEPFFTWWDDAYEWFCRTDTKSAG